MKLLVLLLVSLLSPLTYSKDITVKVQGMVCSMCAQGIHKKFSKIEGVKDIKVDLDSKLVTIITKDDQDLEDKKIKEIITEAGYNVATIERK